MIRKAVAIFMILAGVAGLVLPVIPGMLLLASGFLLLSKK
jgi:uncharacterized protein YqgC (DUF456 family)